MTEATPPAAPVAASPHAAPPRPQTALRVAAIVLAAAATAGLVFAAFSTAEFAQHLDRQVHDIHCSFIPGAEAEAEEASGCEVAMMSPYSSVMRTKVWGGLPIALPAMGIFAFLIWRALDLMLRQRDQRKAAANFLIAASVIPVGASVVMGYIAATELGAACKICIGIYGSSAAVLIASLLCRRAVVKDAVASGIREEEGALKVWLTAGAQLAAFVAIPAALYLALAPDFSRYLGTCSALREQDDPYGIMVELGGDENSVTAIEIFDPLCPACRAFEQRLDASEVQSQLHRKAVMFPLDKSCNWMVSRSLHPGACTVSKAVLCADQIDGSATAVIDWAFAQQEAILDASKKDPEAAMRMVKAEFPTLAECVGSAEVEARLNKSLRFAVRNSIPVLTPQLYVAGVKVCDQDTDLGLDWALARMLELHAAGQLHGEAPPAVPEAKLEPVPKKAKSTTKTRSKKKETP
jgi:uncharacterized membrane protein